MSMANEEHLKILKQGVEVWNEWREGDPDSGPDLTGADLTDADLTWADLTRADLTGADLRGADLTGVNLEDANLSSANLKGADLKDAAFVRTDLTSANLSFVILEHTNLIGANLKCADLKGANLRDADIESANLSSANITSADLTRANLYGANLEDANFTSAILNSTDLSGANLTGANFTRANLTGANLTRTNVTRTIFFAASVSRTIFADTDLSQAKNLDRVKHKGPSEITVSTLYQSAGKIPETFLRGCGVPDDFITFIPSHFGIKQAIQFYSCFISYSTKDEEFARRLYSRMRDEKLRVWFAPEDIKGGKKIHEQLERAIQLHDRLLLVLSEHSIQSPWVETEIRKARQAEVKQKRRKLFPIRLVDFDMIREWECFDADTGKDLAVEVREYFIPDFSNWKDYDAFEEGFQKLLQDLMAEELKQ